MLLPFTSASPLIWIGPIHWRFQGKDSWLALCPQGWKSPDPMLLWLSCFLNSCNSPASDLLTQKWQVDPLHHSGTIPCSVFRRSLTHCSWKGHEVLEIKLGFPHALRPLPYFLVPNKCCLYFLFTFWLIANFAWELLPAWCTGNHVSLGSNW